MKFKMEVREGYTKAEKIVVLDTFTEHEIQEWVDAGYEVILTAIKGEVVKEGATDDF